MDYVGIDLHKKESDGWVSARIPWPLTESRRVDGAPTFDSPHAPASTARH